MAEIFTTIILLFILSTFTVQGRIDAPFEWNRDSYHLISNLIDKNTQQTYSIEAYVDGNTDRGRIDIRQACSLWYTLFYHHGKVLAFQDNWCTVHRFQDNEWDETLPSDERGIITIILAIMGPRIVWTEGSTLNREKIEKQPLRGWPQLRIMKYSWNDIEMIKYFLADSDYQISAPSNPNQGAPMKIEISGQYQAINPQSVQLTLNTHLFEPWEDSILGFLIPTQGIGCPSYLALDKRDLPSFDNEILHFFERVSNSDGLMIYREVYSDVSGGMHRYKTVSKGQIEESIVDTQLQMEFKFNDTKGCINKSDESINDDLALWGSEGFQYVGRMLCTNRRIHCDIHESVKNKATLDRIMYEKLVTTIYIAIEENGEKSAPIEIISTGYQLDQENLKKTFSMKREIFEFEKTQWIPISEVLECYSESDEQAYYQLYVKPLSSTNSKSALEAARENPLVFKAKLLDLVSRLGSVAKSRIPEIELSFMEDTITARILVLQRPRAIPYQESLDGVYARIGGAIRREAHELKWTVDYDLGPLSPTSFTYQMNTIAKVPRPVVVEDEYVESLVLFPGYGLRSGSPRTRMVPIERRVKSLAQCYRACKDSTELSCRMFSFCTKEAEYECTITNEYTEAANSSELFMESSDCSVYSKEFLIDITKYGGRLFPGKLVQPLPGKFSPESCAKECFLKGDECKTFQHCPERDECALINHTITDDIEETGWENGLCSLYGEVHFPKYKLTGSYLVGEYFRDANAYTIEECAGRCYHSMEKSCASFNYCPEKSIWGKLYLPNDGRSCQLSEQRVDSPEVQTVKSTACFNYELAEEAKPFASHRENLQRSEEAKLSGFRSFGIILAFTFVGFITGAVGLTLWKSYGHRLTGLSLRHGFRWGQFTDEEN